MVQWTTQGQFPGFYWWGVLNVLLDHANITTTQLSHHLCTTHNNTLAFRTPPSYIDLLQKIIQEGVEQNGVYMVQVHTPLDTIVISYTAINDTWTFVEGVTK